MSSLAIALVCAALAIGPSHNALPLDHPRFPRVQPDADGVSRGFEVTYGSPTQGEMAFAWTGPLTVGGTAA